MNTEASYEPHPAAELFPMMPTDQYETFREDIRKNGFQQDIVLYKGQILDGRCFLGERDLGTKLSIDGPVLGPVLGPDLPSDRKDQT